MAKVEEKRRKAKANAASLTERIALRASPSYQAKSQPLMGDPESGQPLVLLMLGERSYEKYEKGGADQGNLQFASALLDCGCSSITLIDEDTLKKWRQHFGKMVRKVRWLKSPLVVNTAGDDKPLIVAMAEVYVVLCHETGTSEAGWVECDVMRGGNTGGCTLIIGNKFMRKQTVGMHFSEENGEGGHIQSEKWGKKEVPMFWKAKDLEKMGERVATKLGVETRELKKMSFSGEIQSNVKVTSISAEQREGAKEAKGNPTPKKTGKKKVHFEKELAEYAPRSKVYMSQQAFNEDQGDETPEKGERGERKVMKLSTETMAQAAKELGQVAARCKLERLERERGKLPEEERKNASFDVESNKELPQLGKLLEEDHAKATESWMYLTGDNKWVAVRLNLPHFKDLIDLSLASHKLSASTHTAEELKLCADQADTHLVPVIKRGRPASEVMMKDPHRVIPIREGLIGSIEERPEYLELKVSQKEKDERAEKEKEAKQKRRKHWEESKQKGSGGKGAAKKAVRLALDAKTLRCALYLFSLTLDLIPGQASMARGQVRRGGKPLKGQNFVVSDNEEGLVKLDEGCLYRTDDMGEAMVPISLREGVNHPVKLSKDDLLMDVELIDEGAFCALKDMKTNSREYAVMRSNVTQEERDFMTEYHKQSEPQGEAHWSEGLGICNPGDYELDSYKQEPKSARTMKKVEDNMGFEETSLPDKHDCTLADLYSGHYNVCSISKETLSRPDVAIMVVLCCGPGGVSHGTVRKMGNTHLITALAIDCDPLSCATHELSHPHIPVVKYEMGEWEDTLALIHRYVPKVLMSKTYIHVSNSCRQASTGNITFRDLSQAQHDTDWYLALLAKTRCVAWTLENVPSLLRKYEGVYPTSRVFAMNAFCAMGQSRKRMILSNIALDIPKYSGKVVTARDILGEMKGWKQHEKYWQRNSYGDARSVDTPSFTVTGGAHHIGAPTLGEMYSEHIPGWRERAMLNR